MVSHEYKLIFIHIPKCGGTIIEHVFDVAPFEALKPDYDKIVGWCPKRKIYMQHATAQQLLELDLIDEARFKDYLKVAVVRNPYTRAVSDYYWHLISTGGKGSFHDYLTSKGPFKVFHKKSGTPKDYTSHIINQLDYIQINGKTVVDKIIRFENFNTDLEKLLFTFGKKIEFIPHEKKGNYKIKYKSLYNWRNRKALVKRDIRDLKYFMYTLPKDD